MRLRSLLLPVMAASAALLAGCGSSTNKATGARAAKPVVLTLATNNSADDDIGAWTRAVERLSHGSIRIALRNKWRADETFSERGTLADVRAGRVDAARIAARAWDTLGVKSFQALQAPLLVDSLALEERVLTGSLGAEMLAGVRTAGVEPVAVLPGPLRRPLGVSRDVLGPEDYRGGRIGSRPAGVAAATARALEAAYVDVAAGGSLDGLDVFDAGLADIDFSHYDRQARSVTINAVLWPGAVTLVVNRGTWRHLAPAQREVLVRAGDEAIAPTMGILREYERSAVHALCERQFRLVQAGADGIRDLRRAVEPVHRALEEDAATRLTLARIRELKAHTPAAPAPRCRSQAPRSTPAPDAGPLVGTWQGHATRALMAAADREIGESVEDNYGDVTLDLASNGRYEFRNARFPGELAGLGSWSVHGNVISMHEEGTVEQGAGTTWRYGWTLFHGALVLHKLAGAPTALTVAPLRRG